MPTFSAERRSPSTESKSMARLRSFVNAQKPDVRINFNSKKKSYTTLDTLAGSVTVRAPVDTHFDAVHVEFVGTSRTYVERLTTAAAVSGRSEAFHQFLKLTQPDLDRYYPPYRILKAGQSYEFPFVFVVPQHLLPRVCQHKVHNPAVRDAHLLLPPTFGDKALASQSGTVDDMAPDMASVRYGIFAKVSKIKVHDDEVERVSLASKARRLRVVPAVDDLPPLAVAADDADYVMRREKSIRKGVLKGKLGALVMEAAQPQALRLTSSGPPDAPNSTMATVMLRFDPAEQGAQPPRIGNLSSKLKVETFFSSTARYNFPIKNASLIDLSQGLHTEQLHLSYRCMANVEWTKHAPTCGPPNPLRRDSACSASSLTTGDIPAPSVSHHPLAPFYTARILVPIALPANKTFVPTFHSCLISRIYILKLDLSLQSAIGGIGGGASLELRVPLQVSSERASRAGDLSSARRESVDDADNHDHDHDHDADSEDVEDFFEPRTIRAPPDGVVGRSRIGSAPAASSPGDAPPGYSPFASGRSRSVPVY